MRLTKTMYIVEEIQGEYIGEDELGRPIWGDPQINHHPIPCEIEPYSSGLAETTYGVFIEVTNRAFCKPDDRLVVGVQIKYNNEDYTISEPPFKYDRHYEVLIKKV